MYHLNLLTRLAQYRIIPKKVSRALKIERSTHHCIVQSKPNKNLIFLHKKAKTRPNMISNSKKWNNFLNIFLKNRRFYEISTKNQPQKLPLPDLYVKLGPFFHKYNIKTCPKRNFPPFGYYKRNSGFGCARYRLITNL